MTEMETEYSPLRVEINLDFEEGETCMFCEATAEGEHEDCPFVTGVYTADAPRPCDDCGKHLVGMACFLCREPIEEGHPYRLLDGTTGLLAPAPALGYSVCVVCAAAQSEALMELLAR
ncbi:MAG: hypothetical protein ACJ79H_03520 [Myxococcales bacterium]